MEDHYRYLEAIAEEVEAELKSVPDLTLPPGFSGAFAFMVNRPFLDTPRWQEQQWRAVRVNCHSDILEFERRFIKRCVNLGIPMYAHNMFRTPSEQAALYVRGVTKAAKGNSPHNHGLAVDIVHSVYHWNMEKPCWDLLGHLGKEVASQAGIAVTWGGDWKFYDPAHWEIASWRNHVGHDKDTRTVN